MDPDGEVLVLVDPAELTGLQSRQDQIVEQLMRRLHKREALRLVAKQQVTSIRFIAADEGARAAARFSREDRFRC